MSATVRQRSAAPAPACETLRWDGQLLHVQRWGQGITSAHHPSTCPRLVEAREAAEVPS